MQPRTPELSKLAIRKTGSDLRSRLRKDDLIIRPLNAKDAMDVVSLLRRQSADYTRFFTPFSFDTITLLEILKKQDQDVYMGLYRLGQLAGLFMLRGWDEGYKVPAFGILIDQDCRGSGLEMLSLETAKIICRLRGAPGMITKVHPDNLSAKGVARKIGFALRGADPQTGNLVYHCEIKQRPNSSREKSEG